MRRVYDSPRASAPEASRLRLARRTALAAILCFVALRAIPSLLSGGNAEYDGVAPPTLESRLIEVAPRGEGRWLAVFEADEVTHASSGWALLDRSEGEVLVLDTAGALVRRVGRRGEGPGELSRPHALALDHQAGVAVLDASGQRVDLFPAAGLPRRLVVPAGSCRGTFGDVVLRHAEAWWTARRCYDGLDADLEVHRIDDAGTVERIDRRPLVRGRADPHMVPLLLAMEGAVYAGSNLYPCLDEVSGEASRELCLPRPHPLAIPDSLRERMFGGLARRAAAVGLGLDVPTHYPGIVGVRSGSNRAVVRTIVADGSDRWAFEQRDTLWIVDPPRDTRIAPGAAAWLILKDEGNGLRAWTSPIDPR